MTRIVGEYIERQDRTRNVAGFAILLLCVALLSCNSEPEPASLSGLQERYHLSDAEARLWDSLWVDEAESIATLFWTHVGLGEFEQAMLTIERYGDPKMKGVFEGRITNLWQPIYQWPAANFTEEPEIDLGPGETIGFRTWGELLAGGFQRAVLCDDSITVYFVFKGYWQTDRMPLYAAVGCGDFGKENPNWRPFPSLVFSVDNSEAVQKRGGGAEVYTTLDGFLQYLRQRTFGSFGT